MLPPYEIREGLVTLGGDALPDDLLPIDTAEFGLISKSANALERLKTGVRWNLSEVVRAALADGADANSSTEVPNSANPKTVLNVAVMQSGKTIITMLLDAGAQPTWVDFQLADGFSRPDVIALFCERGFEPDERSIIETDPPRPEIRC